MLATQKLFATALREGLAGTSESIMQQHYEKAWLGVSGFATQQHPVQYDSTRNVDDATTLREGLARCVQFCNAATLR